MGEHDAALTHRLRSLSNQMMQIAGDITRRHAPPAAQSVLAAFGQDSDMWLLAAKEMYRDRTRRGAHFTTDLFGEAAWDILLDLYIAEKEGRDTSVMSACLAAQVPSTTALRYLQQLEAEGLVLRTSDPRDRRRYFVRISDEGYARMTAYLAERRKDWLAEAPR